MRKALVCACVFGASALAACNGPALEDAAPRPEPTGIAIAAPGARGASFDPAPLPVAPSLPAVPPSLPPSLKGQPPDPFGGALPDEPSPVPPPSHGASGHQGVKL